MSGVLLKTGIYGLLRAAGFFEAPPASWGVALMVLGGVSGVLGVALALAQHDLKRLLAYHSVENIGIITMGVGLAMLGRARGDPGLVLLGFAGGALHVVNHALFKSLLFLGAGSVQHATGTRDVERLGGLARAMPWTAGLFLVGAAAISGLPPLNGFVSEWFVALGAVRTLDLTPHDPASFAVLLAPVLAFVGALAAACFVKVQGTVFLGNARTAEAGRAHESPRTMLIPMAVLAAACVAIGALPALVVAPLARAASAWSGMPLASLAGPAEAAVGPAGMVAGVALVLVAAVLVLWLLRRLLGAGVSADTWGCGYAYPTARMAYTGSLLRPDPEPGLPLGALPQGPPLAAPRPLPRRGPLLHRAPRGGARPGAAPRRPRLHLGDVPRAPAHRREAAPPGPARARHPGGDARLAYFSGVER